MPNFLFSRPQVRTASWVRQTRSSTPVSRRADQRYGNGDSGVSRDNLRGTNYFAEKPTQGSQHQRQSRRARTNFSRLVERKIWLSSPLTLKRSVFWNRYSRDSERCNDTRKMTPINFQEFSDAAGIVRMEKLVSQSVFPIYDMSASYDLKKWFSLDTYAFLPILRLFSAVIAFSSLINYLQGWRAYLAKTLHYFLHLVRRLHFRSIWLHLNILLHFR